MSEFVKRITVATAVLLVFAAGQVCNDVNFAQSGSVVTSENEAMMPQQTMGILTTQGNKEITVNDTNAISGATIVSGARIETPAETSATVGIDSPDSLEIEPNTKLSVEIHQRSVKVTLAEGCVSLRTTRGTTGEISTAKGYTAKTDSSQDGKLGSCPGRSPAAIVPAGAGADGLFALGTAAARTIIARGVTSAAVPVAPRGILY